MIDETKAVRIVNMYLGGTSPKEIAKKVGFSYQAICRLLFKLRELGANIPKKRRTEIDYEKLANKFK